MACDRMRELALLSIDGELSEAERTELAAHLEQCADCRAARDAAARVAEGVRRLAPPPVPLGFAERTLKRLDEAPAPARRRPLPWIVPIAAAAATIVAVALFLVERRPPRAAPGSLVASEPQAARPESLEKAPTDGDKRGLADDPSLLKLADGAPEGGEERVKDLDELTAADDKTAGLLAQLASDSPAAALRRIAELPEGEKRRGELESSAERSRENERGYAKNDEERFDEKEQPLAGKRPEPARPVLRFLRVRVNGDAGRLDEFLAKELARWKAPRDDAGRGVVDLDAEEAKSLRERLAKAGLVVEELTAAEWLRAAQATPVNEGLLARGDADRGDVLRDGGHRNDVHKAEDEEKARKEEPPKLKAAPEASKKGAAPAQAPARLEGRAGGGNGAAAPASTAKPRPIERCFFLIGR